MTFSAPLVLRTVIERKSAGLPRFVVVPSEVVAPWRLGATTVVDVTLNGRPIGRRSLKHWGRERDCWFLDLTQAQCDRAGVDSGDSVSVELRRGDTAPPKELADLLEASSAARAAWDSLTAARQRSLGEHVRSAKRAETRARRASAALLPADDGPAAAGYVHGYGEREAQRLLDQASSVRDLIHHDTEFPVGSLVLEVGCGVGAQTVALASRDAGFRLVSFDKQTGSVLRAAERVRAARVRAAHLLAGDLFAAPFRPGSFGGLFVSYLLEHLPDPVRALRCLSELLEPGGEVLVVEGDHGSCYFHPSTPEALRAWSCLIEVQAELGGDSLVGRRLHPLLGEAGYEDVRVSPRMVYADASLPTVRTQFVLQTIVPMVEGVRDRALAAGLMTGAEWAKGIRDLKATGTRADGTFCYTFFKARARTPR
jgi:SAM-dependent methyltransferase